MVKTGSKREFSTPDFIRNSLSGCQTIPSDQINQLILNARNGSVDSRNKVINSYLPYVYKLASSFFHKFFDLCNLKDIEFEDLFQSGVEALYKALKNYNPQKANFTTYSTFWINKYLYKHLEDTCKTTDIDDCEGLEDLPVRRSLDSLFLKYDLDRVLARYSKEEQLYLSKYYGLDDSTPKSMPQIARKYKVSYSHVQRTLKKAETKLHSDDQAKAVWEDYQAA